MGVWPHTNNRDDYDVAQWVWPCTTNNREEYDVIPQGVAQWVWPHTHTHTHAHVVISHQIRYGEGGCMVLKVLQDPISRQLLHFKDILREYPQGVIRAVLQDRLAL